MKRQPVAIVTLAVIVTLVIGVAVPIGWLLGMIKFFIGAFVIGMVISGATELGRWIKRRIDG